MDGKQTEEDYLHETLAMLQESYKKAAKPYVDRLLAIQAMKPTQPIMVTREQYEAMGLKVPNAKLTGLAPREDDK